MFYRCFDSAFQYLKFHDQRWGLAIQCHVREKQCHRALKLNVNDVRVIRIQLDARSRLILRDLLAVHSLRPSIEVWILNASEQKHIFQSKLETHFPIYSMPRNRNTFSSLSWKHIFQSIQCLVTETHFPI